MTVIEWQGKDLGIGAGRVWDMVAGQVIEGHSSQLVFHRPQPVLDVAAAVAVTRPVGDGAWLWDRVEVSCGYRAARRGDWGPVDTTRNEEARRCPPTSRMH